MPEKNKKEEKKEEKTEQELFEERVAIMPLEEKLSRIQLEMKVPKNLYNKFGNYNYRNAETILETAKPICTKYHCTLVVGDNIELIGDRFYVKAIASLVDWTTKYQIQVTAFAREQESKKGMDEAQITGACSSYARKYALNGLFNLDDNKDPDTDENHMQSEGKQDNETMARLKIVLDKLRKDIEATGTDVHGDDFKNYVIEKTNVQSAEHDYLMQNPKQASAVIELYKALYNAILEKKQNG